jgi:TetR/AcrR family transcriptional regulator, cholesterol catabolism regulator
MTPDEQIVTRRERKQRATREGLLAAALSLFAERGYERTTMDDIADRADVARATAFNYFPRKEEFLLAWAHGRRAVVADLLTREQAGSVDVWDRLRHALMSLCDNLEADTVGNQALTRAWFQAGGPLLPDAFATATVFADTLRYAQTRGELRPGVDVDSAGRVLLDAYLGALVRWATNDEKDPSVASLRDQLDAMLDLVINGLGSARTPVDAPTHPGSG